MSDASEKRKAIPVGVKLQAALLALGFEPGEEVDYDHVPPLALRPWNEDRTDTVPPANDPAHIQILRREDHRRKTSGTKATSAGSDVQVIAKSKRLAREEEAFRRKMLAKAGLAEPANDDKPRRKVKMPSRPFPKRTKEQRP